VEPPVPIAVLDVDARPETVPEGTILVHIGPPKTATTQVQAALYAARPALRRQGVRHAGASRHPAGSVHAVLGRASAFAGGVVPPITRWTNLVRAIHRAPEGRVVVSSEFFADAPPDAIRRIVDDLGPHRVRVVVTLRPLARVLPSQWMQFVCDGMTTSWDDWLHAMFDRPGQKVSPGFWRRHRHHELVARWAQATGPDRVTVLAIREGDRGGVLRDFEALLGVVPGVLREQEGLGNRSLTWPEVEAVRAFNTTVRADGMGRVELHRVMHYGASRYMKDHEPDPAAPRIELPDWVLPFVRAEADANVERIPALGVRVAGDLPGLAVVPDPTARPAPDPSGGPVVAANLAIGVLIASGLAKPGPAESREDMSMLATSSIRGYILRRIVKAVRGRLPRPRLRTGAR
jgi:hypothetical protein